MGSILDGFVRKCNRYFDGLLKKDMVDETTIYIPRTAEHFPEALHDGKRAFDLAAKHSLDPFVFLTGRLDEVTQSDIPREKGAVAPFLALLVGQYGTGKTEFCYRLCKKLEPYEHPLPISLALCRGSISALDQPPNAEEYLRLILTGVSEVHGRRPPDDELVDQIRGGRIYLVLDALDELVEKPHQHRNFFSGLRRLLIGEGAEPQFRVLVTMRREYLSSLDARGSEMLNKFNRKKPYYPVYFLGLEHFTDREIQDYLTVRLPRHKRLFDNLKSQSAGKLLYALKRPLLVKIFADMASGCGYDKFEKLLEISEAAHLLEHYIEESLAFAKVRQSTLGLSDYVWDNDLLADHCVELYRRSVFSMTDREVAELRVPVVEHPNVSENPLESVSKCPFLLRERETVRFAHRVFYEYFTAKGLLREAEERGDESDAFNELVVNADMRKFLKYMVSQSLRLKRKFPEYTWHELTKKSCALTTDDADDWPIGPKGFLDPETRRKLNRVQSKLLDGMTEPEMEDPEVEVELDWFLRHEDRKQGWHFHPKFLMYCYHAAATYIHERQWGDRRIERRQRLSDILQDRIGEILNVLEKLPPDAHQRKAWELLVERILDIGLMLRFRWVRRHYVTRNKWLATWKDKDSKTRIHKILDDIKDSVF